MPKADQPRLERRPKGRRARRRSTERSRLPQHSRLLAGGLERLEERALLAVAPWSVSPATVTAQEGAPIASEQMATITDNTGTLTASAFTATINWGDGTTTVADVGNTTLSANVFGVFGSHTYAEEGPETVRVTVNHAGDAPIAITETVAVSDPAVIASGGMTLTAVEAAAPNDQLLATFTDPGGNESVDNYSAQIFWGDGNVSSGTIAFNPGGNDFEITGGSDHAYASEGTDTITVVVHHKSAPPATATSAATVSDPSVVPATVIGFSGTPTGGSFTLNVNGQTTASIAYNEAATDLQNAVAALSPAFNGNVSVSGSGIVTDPWVLAFTGALADAAPPKFTADSSGLIGAAGQPAPTVSFGYTYTGLEGGVAYNEPVARFTDPAGPEPVSSYSASVVWGDGATTAGTISRQAGQPQFTVSAAHQFVEEGSGPIIVVLNHAASLPVTIGGMYSIADSPLMLTAGAPIAAEEGIPLLNAPVATFVDLGGPEPIEDYTVAIDWGDGAVSPGTVSLVPATSTTTAFFSIVGSHLYNVGGRQTITVRIHHDTAPDSLILTNANVGDPSVVATGNYVFKATEAALSTNQPVATFTDPGGAATLPGGAVALDKYSATINWGDGTAAGVGTVSFDQVSEIFTVSGQHTYAEEGTYPISVVVNHDVAASVTAASMANVADPAVTVTGGASVTATEYRSFGPQTLAVFNDPAGNESAADYSATINWGDGTTSAGSIVGGGVGVLFDVQGSHIFTRSGPQNVSVTVHHDSAPDASANSTVTVSLPPISLTTKPLTWKEWSPLEAPDNALANISFVDNNTRVSIDWGDGVTSAGSVTPFVIGGAGAALGLHTWTEASVYNVTVTVLDGPDSASQSFPVTVLKAALPIANPSLATPNNYYVAEVYEDVLRRPVDGGGLSYWSGLLDRGVPRTAVSNALLGSDEYLANFVIRPAYQRYLGRDADASGVSYWLGQMHHGLTDEGLAAALASSSEFYFNAGGGTNAGLVAALYRVVLGRAADPNGESFWLGQLARGESAYNVALGFATSAEDRTSQIDAVYSDLLGRLPTAAELNQWQVAFQTGQATNESLIAGIAATDEYFARAVNE